jgi:hypothetical protein
MHQGFIVKHGEVSFPNTQGKETDENGLEIALNISLMLPNTANFSDSHYLLPVVVSNPEAVFVSSSLFILGLNNTFPKTISAYYAGVDNYVSDGTKISSITFGPLYSVGLQKNMSDTTYTIRNIYSYDNDGNQSVILRSPLTICLRRSDSAAKENGLVHRGKWKFL